MTEENQNLNRETSESEEEKEVEVFEFSLCEDEIDEFIVKLVELKHTKTSFDFEVDDDNDLLVTYDDEEEDEVEEGTRPSDAGLEGGRMNKRNRRGILEGLTIVQNVLEREMLESESREDSHFSFKVEYAPSNIGNPYPNGHELLRLKISVWEGGATP